MNEHEIKRFSVHMGAEGGMIAFLVLFLLSVGVPTVLTWILSTSWVGISPEEWAAEGTRNLLLFLLAGLPVVAAMGGLTGAGIGLSCHWIIKSGYPSILTLLSGVIIGAIAGFLTAAVLVVGSLSIVAGTLYVGGFWSCSTFTCAVTGLVGLIISRGIVREHPWS